jgi:hypothetical protein
MIQVTRATLMIMAFCGMSFQSPSDDFCGIRNTAFQDGEEVTMKVY